MTAVSNSIYLLHTTPVLPLPVRECFARLWDSVGHVSECSGQIGDRNRLCSSLCGKGTCNAEDISRLGVGPELFGCEGRSGAAVRRLPARVPGVSAVQEAAEVTQLHRE